MATVFLCPISAVFQYFTDIGIVLAGGKINTYLAGTTTPTATYTDQTGVTPNANPLSLGSNGRLVGVQIWQPQGIALKIIITDANNVQLGPVFDQITGINDPTTIQTAYANPAGGSGADLIANAMRSYGLLTDLRAGVSPPLSGGQTLIVRSEGLLGVNDGYGGLFYWNASSNATDDGLTAIKPTAVVGAGRYLLLRGGAPAIYIAKTTTTARASTTTLTTDPDLVFTTFPNAPLVSWAFEALLMFNGTGSGAGGISVALQNSPSGSLVNNPQNLAVGTVNGAAFAGKSAWIVSTTPAAQITAATITTAASGNDALYISGAISQAQGGSFGIAWAQNSSSGNACNMLAGSWIRLSVAK
jgi:hypothetical protein